VIYAVMRPESSRPYSRVAARRTNGIQSLYFHRSNDGPGGAYRLLTRAATVCGRDGFSLCGLRNGIFTNSGGCIPTLGNQRGLAMITSGSKSFRQRGWLPCFAHSHCRRMSVVDNLSNGRVAISFASGWMPETSRSVPPITASERDHVHDLMSRRLWRGERVPMPGPLGKDVPVKIFPRPVRGNCHCG